jgi:hypothetical protein
MPIMIDTTCRSSLQKLLDRPDFTPVEWAAVKACIEDRLPGNPIINEEEAIVKCVEELTSAIQAATATSAPKRLPRADPLPSLPDSIRDDICLKNRLRFQSQITRNTALNSRVNRFRKSLTYQLN